MADFEEEESSGRYVHRQYGFAGMDLLTDAAMQRIADELETTRREVEQLQAELSPILPVYVDARFQGQRGECPSFRSANAIAMESEERGNARFPPPGFMGHTDPRVPRMSTGERKPTAYPSRLNVMAQPYVHAVTSSQPLSGVTSQPYIHPVTSSQPLSGVTSQPYVHQVTTSSHQLPAVTSRSSPEQHVISGPQQLGGSRAALDLSLESQQHLLQVATTMDQLALKTSLPPLTVVKFDGNPAEYHRFQMRFQDMVASQNLSDSQKMARLMQFVDGKAKRAIEAFDGVPGGIRRALDTLQRRFGQPHVVAEACVQALVGGSNISTGDSQALQEFADKSRAVLETLVSLKAVGEMNMSNLGKMSRKLPPPLQYRWRDKAQRIRDGGVVPHLSDLVDFIERAADAANDPVFGHVGEPRKSNNNNSKQTHPSQRSKERASTFTTQVAFEATAATKCWDCGGDHVLMNCPGFKAKNQKQRHALVRSKGLCFNCFRKNHGVAECKSEQRCRVCKGKHHSLLHREKQQKTENIATDEKPAVDQKPAGSVNAAVTRVTSNAMGYAKSETPVTKIALQVVPVKVIGENGNAIKTYALLDSASEESFVDGSLAKQLNITSAGEETMNICTLNGESSMRVGKSTLTVEAATGSESLQVPVKVVETLNVSTSRPTDISRWSHLKGITLPSVDRDQVSLLIGTNVPAVQVHFESRIGREGEPYAVRTVLGWSIFGPLGKEKGKSGKRDSTHVNFIKTGEAMSETIDQMKQFLGFENCPISSQSKGMSVEDRKALEIMEASTKKVGDQYEIGMLWRNKDVWLPDNRPVAEKRLQSLKRKFLDEDYKQKYCKFMEMLISRGYARKLNEQEVNTRGPRTWYLPHHGVIHPQKPNKVRVVFDAASKYQGVSLNNQLMQGPDLTNSLLGVLFRFRQGKIAIVGDIEKMFLQVKVSPEDADSLRFLWWEDSVDDVPSVYQMLRHIFGAADSPSCCNFILKRTADDCRGNFNEETIESVKKECYVDDYLKSLDLTSGAIDMRRDVTSVVATGGFHLTEWMSNSRSVLASIPESERSKPSLDLDLDDLPISRTLGQRWDVERDIFQFKVLDRNKPLTKRGVLSTLSSLFDPMGFVCPVVLEAKNLMQCLWKQRIGWDDPMPEEVRWVWKRWLDELSSLSKIEIPRCYLVSGCDIVETSLHSFADASESGYGMCAYLRFVLEDGTVSCAFVTGRSRCAPVRTTTIPRLELQAAVLAARVCCFLTEEMTLKIDKSVYWSDSQVTLQYILNEKKRFHTYVANRVTEIRALTNPDQWKHCPGPLNPADDASRGLRPEELTAKEHRWWRGPEFLWKSEDHWPHAEIQEVSENDIEVKTGSQVHVTVGETGLNRLIHKTGSWPTLLRRVAWVVRFCKGIKTKTFATGNIQLEELEEASYLVVKGVQSECFSEEISRLKNGKEVSGTSPIANLGPILVNGQLRVGGRLERAPTLSDDEKHPLILPRKHHISILITRHCHEKLAHCGREQTVAETRKKYWILGGRGLAKKLNSRCCVCRHLNAKTMEQVMSDLPRIRLVPYKPPFTYSGVDFFGPLTVKWGRRDTRKRWGCLFTCLTTRAVFLEVAQSLSTDDFLLVLRQFVSRRGPPEEIRSDHGSNFVGADRELRESINEWNQNQIDQDLQQRGIKWTFHPPTAAHMSGVWERLVQSTKKHLKAVSGTNLLTDEGLRTLFAEVEAILNGRPLTTTSDDARDCEPLTPNHFLLQRKVTGLPPGIFVKEDGLLRKEWRKVQYLTELFWDRWTHEYLPSLQQRDKWSKRRRNIQEGDVVLLNEDNLSRNRWPLARVMQVFPGADGMVRSAMVKTATSEYQRPIAKMCLIEESVA
jgi:transposase InsO family protein